MKVIKIFENLHYCNKTIPTCPFDMCVNKDFNVFNVLNKTFIEDVFSLI